MARALVLLAEGFEEIEAITPIDVLRRAGVEVVTVGVGGERIVGGHGIPLEADATLDDAPTDDVDVVVLPGGLKGAQNLQRSAAVQSLVKRVHESGKRVAAICASPAVALGSTGVLAGKTATCYPGFEDRFAEGVTRSEERVVVDGTVVTSRGPGTAFEFALTLVEQLVSPEKAAELRRGMIVAS